MAMAKLETLPSKIYFKISYLGHLVVLEESEEPGVLGAGAGDGGVQDVRDHGAVPHLKEERLALLFISSCRLPMLIRGQYQGHMTTLDQSEASIMTTHHRQVVHAIRSSEAREAGPALAPRRGQIEALQFK